MKLRLPKRTKRTREWRWTTDRRKAEKTQRKTQHTPKPATTRSDNRTPHSGIARLTDALPRTPILAPLNTPARRHTLTAITHIAALELRTTARTRLTWTITATWTALIYGFLLLALATTGTNAPTLLHSITATTTLITTLILAPILGVTPLARTRATGLLDMFRLTGFTPRTISWGTTLATTTQYTLLLLIATPALAIGTLLGNANPLDLAGTLLTLAVTGWTLTCLGSATATLIAHRALASFTAITLTGALILTPVLLFSALLPLTNEATNAHVATSTPLHTTNGHHPEQFITCTVTNATRHRNRPDHIWWLLLPQPFITLADAAPRIPHTLAFEPLTA
ncbi:hypothetical protein, partial [Dermatophilus congolensis]